ncbi:hypothetical protein [Acidocella sp.]|jgi:hypothetical protein|uniref:hypothetical protein n=1 Tax=Acidocella sp. TaxID=50710 RepID=UPI002F3F08D8
MKTAFGVTLALATAFATALSSAALAAPQHVRVRGTIASVSSTTLVVKTADGKDVSVALNGNTHYLQVAKASLNNIEPGSYIGTATKSVGPLMVALEVVIFPPSMKGSGEGHYGWDKIPDTTLSGTGATTSTMTNGSVTAMSATPSAGVNSTMTNGSVSSDMSKNGAQQLTVTYKGGEQRIIVPPTAPIVTFRPGTMAELTPDARVFINAVENGSTITAGAVAVGIGGAQPPM